METNTTKQNNVKKYAQFLDNNHIITGGEHGCNVIDLTTNKEILKISDKKCDILALHPNKEKVALCSDKTVTIYDTKTAIAEWSTTSPDVIESVTFNPLDTTIFFVHDGSTRYLIRHNYKTGDKASLNCHSEKPLITFNPVKNEMYVITPSFVTLFRNPNSFSERSDPAHVWNGTYSHCAQYSPDGSHMMVDRLRDNMLIINTNNNSRKASCIKPNDTDKHDEIFRNIFFYSNSVLAIISIKWQRSLPYYSIYDSYPSVLHYWDIHENQPIHSTDLLHEVNSYDLSCSPDKTKFMINGRILSVPFKVRYPKDKFPYFLFLIKNSLNKYSDLEMPQDITPLIALNLWAM